MRTVFVLGKKSSMEIEILYSFGTKRPTRNEVARVHKDYPEANVLASYPDEEDSTRNSFRTIYKLDQNNP